MSLENPKPFNIVPPPSESKINDDVLKKSYTDLIYFGRAFLPKDFLNKVYSSKHETVLAVEIKACGKEEVKVIDGGQNKVVAIGKDLIEEQWLGEFIGVAKLSKDFVELFTRSISDLIQAGGKNDYFEAGIQPLLQKTDVHYIDISEYPCLEIDFIEDLESARELFKDKR